MKLKFLALIATLLVSMNAHAFDEPSIRCWAVAAYRHGKTPHFFRADRAGTDEKTVVVALLFEDLAGLEREWQQEHPTGKLVKVQAFTVRGRKEVVKWVCSRGGMPDEVKTWPAATYTGKSGAIARALLVALPFGAGASAPMKGDGKPNGWTCVGVVWYRRFFENGDVGPLTPVWGTFSGVPGANKTSAESEVRTRLFGKLPESTRVASDQTAGVPSGDVQVCWQGAPPSAPMGWPEERRSWASITSNLETFVPWS